MTYPYDVKHRKDWIEWLDARAWFLVIVGGFVVPWWVGVYEIVRWAVVR